MKILPFFVTSNFIDSDPVTALPKRNYFQIQINNILNLLSID